METSGDRLRKARKSAGISSARSAAIRFGWTPSTYASHENGQTPVPPEAAKEYARRFNVSQGWLLTGEGEPRTNQSGEPKTVVPVFGKVGAGAKVVTFDEHSGGFDPVELPNASDNLGCVIVEGDSQYPRYFEGEKLFYPQDRFSPLDLIGRECVVRLTNGQMLIKIIRRGTKKTTFHLESWNAPPMEDQIIDWASPVIFRG
jgi:phage repressor protein C with HTH and peptisase S24 domain